jgi:hypothetical protein
MPIKRCQTGGKKGYKYGDSGKCYLSEAKALDQMQAIKASQARKPKRRK